MSQKDLNRRDWLKVGIGAIVGAAMPSMWTSVAEAEPEDQVRSYRLTAQPAAIDLGGGPSFTALTYNGQVPGPELRVTQGQTLRVELVNRLSEPTTIHWHGLPVPSDMDGVPGLSQEPVPPGGAFVYQFTAAAAGTYFYHAHLGYQLDQGLYGPLIVEPARPEGGHDLERTLVLEDWARVDGGGPNAPQRRPPMGMMTGGMMGRGMMGGGMGGGPLLEPYYDAYAVNGRTGSGVEPLSVSKGDKVRLRLINAASATVFFLRLAGHRLTLLASDGNPVQPLSVDVLRIGMGERYDVEFVADNPGRWLLRAWDSGLGESGLSLPVVYRGTNPGPATPPDFGDDPLGARYSLLRAARPAPAPAGQAEQSYVQNLGWTMHSNFWTINGQIYPDAEQLEVSPGARARLVYRNLTAMPHPMHLHGHSFRVVLPEVEPELWPVKDTLMVGARQTAEIELTADNPGRWLHHCHNLYHMAAGMANVLTYKA